MTKKIMRTTRTNKELKFNELPEQQFKYYSWLLSLVRRPPLPVDDIVFLCLFNREFVGWYKSDADRAKRGLELRKRYLCETGIDVNTAVGGMPSSAVCTMLEMMVSLAYHCETDIMLGSRYTRNLEFESERVGYWFDIFTYNLVYRWLENVGPERQSWMDLTVLGQKNEINWAIDKFLARKYGPDYLGCMFPPARKNWPDRSKIGRLDLWYQLQNYISENFSV